MPDAAMQPPVQLSKAELELVRAALRLLLSMLGREEADEVAEIKALLVKLDATA